MTVIYEVSKLSMRKRLGRRSARFFNIPQNEQDFNDFALELNVITRCTLSRKEELEIVGKSMCIHSSLSPKEASNYMKFSPPFILRIVSIGNQVPYFND